MQAASPFSRQQAGGTRDDTVIVSVPSFNSGSFAWPWQAEDGPKQPAAAAGADAAVVVDPRGQQGETSSSSSSADSPSAFASSHAQPEGQEGRQPWPQAPSPPSSAGASPSATMSSDGASAVGSVDSDIHFTSATEGGSSGSWLEQVLSRPTQQLSCSSGEAVANALARLASTRLPAEEDLLEGAGKLGAPRRAGRRARARPATATAHPHAAAHLLAEQRCC
jgi:hypothetical protein